MFVTKLRPLAFRLLMVATMGLLAGEARAEYDSSGSATIGKTPLGADALKVTGEVSWGVLDDSITFAQIHIRNVARPMMDHHHEDIFNLNTDPLAPRKATLSEDILFPPWSPGETYSVSIDFWNSEGDLIKTTADCGTVVAPGEPPDDDGGN